MTPRRASPIATECAAAAWSPLSKMSIAEASPEPVQSINPVPLARFAMPTPTPDNKGDIAPLVVDVREQHSREVSEYWSPTWNAQAEPQEGRPSHAGDATAKIVQALRRTRQSLAQEPVQQPQYQETSRSLASAFGCKPQPPPPPVLPQEVGSQGTSSSSQESPTTPDNSYFGRLLAHAGAAQALAPYMAQGIIRHHDSSNASTGTGAEGSVSASSAAVASDCQDFMCLISPTWPALDSAGHPDAGLCEGPHPHAPFGTAARHGAADSFGAADCSARTGSPMRDMVSPLDALFPQTSTSLGGSTASEAMSGSGQREIPNIFASALRAIEQHGWDAVHPPGQPAGWTVLHWASAEGRLDVCQRLCAARADVGALDDHGRSAFDCACESGNKQVAQLLAESAAAAAAARGVGVGAAQDMTPSIQPRDLIAGAVGMVEPVTRPPSSAVDPVMDQCWSLHSPLSEAGPAAASVAELHPMAPAHTLHAAPPAAASEAADSCDSPLLQAVPAVYAAAISAIERHGWHGLHGGEPEWTALHWAAAEKRATICERLMRCGADANQPDSRGWSALDYARDTSDEATIRALLLPPSCRASTASGLVHLNTPLGRDRHTLVDDPASGDSVPIQQAIVDPLCASSARVVQPSGLPRSFAGDDAC